MAEHTDQVPGDTGAERYCRAARCGYDLRGLPPSTTRCPECGRAFDSADAATYRRRPRLHWHRHVRRAGLALAVLLLLCGAVWGWFFWGWYSEHQALLALQVSPADLPLEYTPVVRFAPILTTWPEAHLGPAGFIMNRVTVLDRSGTTRLTDFTPVARLHHLKQLRLDFTSAADLSPLAGLTDLQFLTLQETAVTDLSPLAGLPQLQTLFLAHTRIRDLAPLAGLTNLRMLWLDDTRITDLTPLAGLTRLTHLYFVGTRVRDLVPLAGLAALQILDCHDTPVTDLAPLKGLRSLHTLRLPKATITPAQVNALQLELPGCEISRN